MRTDPDPKLKAAMEEVKGILKKHDIGAVVVLSSEDALEYLLSIEASWSCAHYEQTPTGSGHFVRIRTTDLPKEKKQKILEDTVGMFLGFIDVMKLRIRDCEMMSEIVGKHVQEIQHRTRRVG